MAKPVIDIIIVILTSLFNYRFINEKILHFSGNSIYSQVFLMIK